MKFIHSFLLSCLPIIACGLKAQRPVDQFSDQPYDFAKLYTGQLIPLIGLGTGSVDCADCGTQDSCEVDYRGTYELFRDALLSGVRAFDLAFIYGTEKPFGDAMNGLIAEGKLKRSEVFIITKPPPSKEAGYAGLEEDCRYLRNEGNLHRNWTSIQDPIPPAECRHGYDVEASLRESLSRLGTDYVDMLMMHHTDEEAEGCFVQQWRGMEAVVDSGHALSLGMRFDRHRLCAECSNFTYKHYPALVFVEADRRLLPQSDKDISFYQKHGILMGGGGYSRFNDPRGPYQRRKIIQLEDASTKEAYWHKWSDCASIEHKQLSNRIVHLPMEDASKTCQVAKRDSCEIANRYGVSRRQVFLRWMTQLGRTGPGPIFPQSFRIAHIRENLGALSFHLTSADVHMLENSIEGRCLESFLRYSQN